MVKMEFLKIKEIVFNKLKPKLEGKKLEKEIEKNLKKL